MRPRNLVFSLIVAASANAFASAAPAGPPERVGRIAFVEGDVSLQPPLTGYWASAARNYPVAPGEAFWTGDDGRVALQVGAVAAALDNQTELDVIDTDYGGMRLAISQGSASIRLWRDPSAPLAVSTPAGDVHLQRAGLYRVDVGEQGGDGSYPRVEVTVFEGRADAPGGEAPFDIEAGAAAVLDAGLDAEIENARETGIDAWAREREAIEPWRPSPDFSAEMTGVGALAASGDFAVDARYGRIWFPRDVPADWVPYGYGRWVWVAPWGYTWIDDRPWGFAPFHYGRWAQVGGRWGWVPGPPRSKPVYAPALVAFLGAGDWSAGVNLGGAAAVGWAPLAPDEAYRPPYAAETTGATMTVDEYRNASAVTVARADALGRGVPVRRAAITVSAEALAKATIGGAQSVLPPPSLEARLGTGLGAGEIVHTATPPPAKLLAVRQGVRYQPPGADNPPQIAGAKLPAAKPKPHRVKARTTPPAGPIP